MFAAGYSATWAESFSQAQELRAGAVLRLKAPLSGLAHADLERAARRAAVTGLAPVRTMSVSIGGEQANLVGIAPSAIAALTQDGHGLIDTDGARRRRSHPPRRSRSFPPKRRK